MTDWKPCPPPEDGFYLVHEGGAIRTMMFTDGLWEHPGIPVIRGQFGDTIYVAREYRAAHPGQDLIISDCIYDPTEWMELPEVPCERTKNVQTGENS